MLKLFNRLAWLASIGMTLSFFSLFGRSLFYIGGSFAIFIVAMVVAVVFKNVFLPKSYITSALRKGGEVLEKVSNKNNVTMSGDDLKQIENREKKDSDLKDVTTSLTNDLEAEQGGGETLADIFSDSGVKEIKETIEIKQAERQIDKAVIFEKTIKKDSGPNIIQSFFKDNALAKIGGILLFLAVVFLLQLVYNRIGPIGKLMIGFSFGFALFAIGLFLDKKKHVKEARILFGVSILINYLVILSGRYLIGEGLFAGDTILNEGGTFFLLILNTIFAVSVSIAFESRALLFFSFVVAYANPFLISEKINLTIYTILAYSVMVSLGGVFLSIYYKKNNDALASSFLNIAFIGGNILVLFAPFDSAWQWVLKLAVLVFLSIISIYYSYKNKNNKAIAPYFIGVYVFFILLILYGSFELGEVVFSGLTSTFAILIFFATMLLGSVFFFLQFTMSSLFYLTLFPLALILALFGMNVFQVGDLAYILVGAMLLYLLIFSSTLDKISEKMSYFFFSALALFVFFMSMIWNSSLSLGIKTTSSIQDFGIIVSIFMFLFSAYYFSRKKGLEQLYALSSLSTVFILYTVIERSGNLRLISIISIVLFMLMNILWPLANKQLMIRNTNNLIFGMVVGALFAVSELFYFWYGSTNQSTMHLGLSFVALAVIYFFVSYTMYQILDSHNKSLSNDDKRISIGDTVYSVIGVSISIFSLAIVYVFSRHSEIISTILLFESSLLFYFYSRKRSLKIYLAGTILMFVGVAHLFGIIGSIDTREYSMLVPILIIFLSFALSLKFLSFEKRHLRAFHDIAHVLGMFAISGALFMLMPEHGNGYLLLAYSLFALFLSALYGSVFSAQIKNIYIVCLGILFFNQISKLGYTFDRLDRVGLEGLKTLQHLSTIIFFVSILLFTRLSKTFAAKNMTEGQIIFIFNFVFYLYLFVITSQYVYFLFGESEFLITIYWGILSLVFLTYGIQKDFIRIRTIGLYILSLTVLKILLFDIWSGLDDAIMRVIALMLVGGVMIAISVLYGRKYGGDMKGEFNFENLSKGKNESIE
jgi:hypothetical protein